MRKIPPFHFPTLRVMTSWHWRKNGPVMRCCPAPPTHLMLLQGQPVSAPPTHLSLQGQPVSAPPTHLSLQGQPVSAPPLKHSLQVNSTSHDNNDTYVNWIIAQSSSRGQQRGTRTQDHTSSLPWQSADPQTDIAPEAFTFEERVGSTLSMPEDSCPVDFFRAIVNDSFISLIVDETNR